MIDVGKTIRNFNTHTTANGGLVTAASSAVTLIFGNVVKSYLQARFPNEAQGIGDVIDNMILASKTAIGPAILMCYVGMPHGVGDPGEK